MFLRPQEDIDEQSPDKKKVKYSTVADETYMQLVDPKDAKIRYLERQNISFEE